jgi:hypothetical protein
MGNNKSCDVKSPDKFISESSTQTIQTPIETLSSEKKYIEPIKKFELPGFSFVYSKDYDFITDNSCCICFIDYHQEMIMHMLPCNHIMHASCLDTWYCKSGTCPICRDTFDKEITNTH